MLLKIAYRVKIFKQNRFSTKPFQNYSVVFFVTFRSQCNGQVKKHIFLCRAQKVTLTDLPRFVPLLKEGIHLNPKLSHNINIQALTWGEPEDLRRSVSLIPPPDLILVSDCIYYEASIQPLISTLVSCMKILSTSGRL